MLASAVDPEWASWRKAFPFSRSLDGKFTAKYGPHASRLFEVTKIDDLKGKSGVTTIGSLTDWLAKQFAAGTREECRRGDDQCQRHGFDTRRDENRSGRRVGHLNGIRLSLCKEERNGFS